MFLVLIGIIIGLIIVVIFLAKSNSKKTQENKKIQNDALMQLEAVRAACKQQIDTMTAEQASEISLIKRNCEDQIRKAQETIENRRDILAKMSEKDLLINVMTVLDGYGKRFERIEKSIPAQTDKINQSLENNNSIVQNKLTSIQSDIATIKLNASNIPSIAPKLDAISSTVDSVESTVDCIHESISDIYSYNSLASNIDNLADTIDSIESTVNSIHESIGDTYSYDSLVSNINSIKSTIASIQPDNQ